MTPPKVAFEKVALSYSSSFRLFKAHNSRTRYHFHPELELTLIEKGCGTRVIGNHIHEFKENDLVIISGNVPHMYFANKGSTTLAKVIQWKENTFQQLLLLPEAQSLAKIFTPSCSYLHISGKTASDVRLLIDSFFKARHFDLILLFLEMMQRISTSKDVSRQSAYHLKASELTKNNLTKINSLFSYIHSHFSEPIPLQQIASIANFSPVSFSRFFRKTTGKTYVQYLTEVRLNNAKNLLITSDISILDISLNSGFRNLSHFNHFFKRHFKVSPRSFRNKFKQLI